MTRFERVKWRDLEPRDRQAWRAFRAADPGLRSPYFDLGWLDAVDRARGDLQVVKGSRRGEPVAFLPFHPGLMGAARPAGGTFSDWHGFVAAPDADVDARAALAAGPATLRFHGAPAGDRGLGSFAEGSDASNLMDMSGGFEAYARPKGRGAPKAMSEFRRAMRKLEADGRDLQVLVRDGRGETLDALMALKSQQYRRSGHADVFAWGWSRRLMHGLMQVRSQGFEAVLSSLWIDGALAAAHLGMRSGGVLHYWLPAYDPALSAYAPGSVLAVELARAMAADAGARCRSARPLPRRTGCRAASTGRWAVSRPCRPERRSGRASRASTHKPPDASRANVRYVTFPT
jgi:CelD/BcsL family acetyltransferase involved in cellulose biosynthesis